MSAQTLTMLGLELKALANRKEIFAQACCLVEERKPSYAVALNPEKLMNARKGVQVVTILNASSLNYADGVGVEWASSLLNQSKLERYPGVDLFIDLLSFLNREQKSLYLFGAQEAVLKKAMEKIKRDYPLIKICGFKSGFKVESEEVLSEIQQNKPDMVAVALGSPKQEIWMHRHAPACGCFLMGLGGSFDVLAGEVARAPKWIQKLGLEWLYRLCRQPSRLKRQKALLGFLTLVLREKLRGKRASSLDVRG